MSESASSFKDSLSYLFDKFRNPFFFSLAIYSIILNWKALYFLFAKSDLDIYVRVDCASQNIFWWRVLLAVALAGFTTVISPYIHWSLDKTALLARKWRHDLKKEQEEYEVLERQNEKIQKNMEWIRQSERIISRVKQDSIKLIDNYLSEFDELLENESVEFYEIKKEVEKFLFEVSDTTKEVFDKKALISSSEYARVKDALSKKDLIIHNIESLKVPSDKMKEQIKSFKNTGFDNKHEVASELNKSYSDGEKLLTEKVNNHRKRI